MCSTLVVDGCHRQPGFDQFNPAAVHYFVSRICADDHRPTEVMRDAKTHERDCARSGSSSGATILPFTAGKGFDPAARWGYPFASRRSPVGGMDQNGPVLEPPELERFIEDGYLIVRSAVPTELAEECRVSAAQQLGIDLASPNTWRRPVVRGVPTGVCFRQAANAPHLMDAVGQLVNPDAWQPRPNLGAFVVRFPSDEDPGDAGWHIDSSFQPPGDSRWFVNYRSKERALLLLCLLSDVGMDDAPSRLLAGSPPEMARLLASAGEEGLPGAYEDQESQIPLPASKDGEVFATGSAGDVFICHPFLVHAASWPHRGEQPRFLAQPPIAVSDGLVLDRPLNRLSAVARAIRLGISKGDGS